MPSKSKKTTEIFFLTNIYLIIVFIHLYSCFYHIESIRRSTKVLLMPMLILIYREITSAENYSKYIINGLLFGFTGDAILLCDGKSSLLTIGILSFLIGHLLYISLYLREIGRKNFLNKKIILIIIFIFYSFVTFLTFCGIKIGILKRGVFYEATFYLFILEIESCLSCFYFYIKKEKWSFINFLGTNFFWLSDFILIRDLFYNDKIKYYLNFIVMFTYIIGQTFIMLGMSQIKLNKKIEKENLIIS